MRGDRRTVYLPLIVPDNWQLCVGYAAAGISLVLLVVALSAGYWREAAMRLDAPVDGVDAAPFRLDFGFRLRSLHVRFCEQLVTSAGALTANSTLRDTGAVSADEVLAAANGGQPLPGSTYGGEGNITWLCMRDDVVYSSGCGASSAWCHTGPRLVPVLVVYALLVVAKIGAMLLGLSTRLPMAIASAVILVVAFVLLLVESSQMGKFRWSLRLQGLLDSGLLHLQRDGSSHAFNTAVAALIFYAFAVIFFFFGWRATDKTKRRTAMPPPPVASGAPPVHTVE